MSTESEATIEVVREVSVPLSPERTFAMFTTRMTDFWPREHSIGASPLAEVVVESRDGGRWYERGQDGSETHWGRVAVWDPPTRVVLLWQIGADWKFHPDFETEVDVSFTADGPGRTRLQLRHRNLQRYGDDAEQMRAIFGDPKGWAGTLASVVELASAEAAHQD